MLRRRPPVLPMFRIQGLILGPTLPDWFPEGTGFGYDLTLPAGSYKLWVETDDPAYAPGVWADVTIDPSGATFEVTSDTLRNITLTPRAPA
jgi:hypothetical protein